MYQRLACVLALAVAACDGGGSSMLVVDVVTDWTPGEEFTLVETSVFRVEAGASELVGTVSFDASAVGNEVWFDPHRVAERSDLRDGLHRVETRLLDINGEERARREELVDVQVSRSITILLARSCGSLVCPPMDTPELSECFGGRCVAPSCSARALTACGEPECDVDSDCEMSATCVAARCVFGACVQVPDHTRCADGSYCHPEDGCTARSPLEAGDAGGGMADAGIVAAPCGGSCRADQECCAGSCVERGCDDRNPCTIDGCEASGCVNLPRGRGSCDDGVFCNGEDTCVGDTCEHGPPPCPMGTACMELMSSCSGPIVPD